MGKDDKKHSLLPYQDLIFNDYHTPQLCIAAGVGSGKTHMTPRWLNDRLIRAKSRVPHPVAWYVSHTYSILKETCWPAYKEFLDESGIGYHFNKSEMTLELAYGATVVFKSAEAHEKMVGASLVAAVGDEPGRWPDQAFTELAERMRGAELPGGMVRQRLFVGTPQGLTTYMDMFSGPDFQSKGIVVDLPMVGKLDILKEVPGKKKVLHYPTFFNTYINLKEIIPNLLDKYGHDDRLIDAHIFGRFVALHERNVYEFREDNITDFEKSPDYGDIYVSMDFNVGQMAFTAWQKKEDTAFCVGEAPRNTVGTREACEAILDQFPPHEYRDRKMIIHGDASGHSRSTQADHSDYELARYILADKYRDVIIEVPKANKSVRSTIACTNKALQKNNYSYEPIRLYIDRRQSATIYSMYNTVYHENGKDIDKPSGDLITHPSDTVRYFASGEYPMVDLSPLGIAH